MLRLCYDDVTNSLWSERGTFDPDKRHWDADNSLHLDQIEGVSMTATEAVRRIAMTRTLLPVGVIGGRCASQAELQVASEIGGALAAAGFPVMTGGKDGIMQAACEGAAKSGGLTIGVLPDNEWTGANRFVTLPIATGLGSARNAIIARACFALVAIGGEYGTQTEMAFGMHFGRLVLTFGDVPAVTGVIACLDADEAIERIAQRYLALDDGGVDASDDGTR